MAKIKDLLRKELTRHNNAFAIITFICTAFILFALFYILINIGTNGVSLFFGGTPKKINEKHFKKEILVNLEIAKEFSVDEYEPFLKKLSEPDARFIKETYSLRARKQLGFIETEYHSRPDIMTKTEVKRLKEIFKSVEYGKKEYELVTSNYKFKTIFQLSRKNLKNEKLVKKTFQTLGYKEIPKELLMSRKALNELLSAKIKDDAVKNSIKQSYIYNEFFELNENISSSDKDKIHDIFNKIHFRYTSFWAFITFESEEGFKHGGIFNAIFGTVFLVFIMTIAVVPIGVITAIYLHEYAGHNWLTRVIRLAINNLAGVPSIVFGLFGMGFFIYFVGTLTIDGVILNSDVQVFGKPAIIWSSLTLALLTLPVVIVATEEALSSIPKDIREASYALGATKFQTIMKLVIPNAFSGILTGAILAVSRGAGEVAPIIFTGATLYIRDLPTSLKDQFMELGYHIYVLATQAPDVEATKPILYSTVLVLLVLTFLLNLMAIAVRFKLRAKFKSF